MCPNDATETAGPPPRRIRRRRVLRTTGAGISALALAGCQSPDEGGSTSGTDLSGETITLGVMPPDKVSSIGKPMINCMDLAVKQINADGGILGADVEYTVGPTNLSVSHARTEYVRMTQEEDVDATFGIVLQLRSLMNSIANARTLHFTCGNPDPFAAHLVSSTTSPIDGNPEQEYEKYKYHFRYGPPNIDQAMSAMLEFLNLYADDLGWQRAGVLIADLSMLEGVPQRIQRETEGIIEVPYAELVPDGLPDFTPIYDDLESADVDVAFVALALGAPTAITQWANQERPFGLGGALLGAGNSKYWEESNGLVEGVWTAEAVVPNAELTEETGPFLDAYQTEFGSIPGPMGPIVYDAVKLYAEAVRAVGSTNPEDLIPHLEQMTWRGSISVPEFSFHGPDHEYAHDPVWTCLSPKTCGEKAMGAPVLAQWQEAADGSGVQEIFAPEIHKTADYQQPPWMR